MRLSFAILVLAAWPAAGLAQNPGDHPPVRVPLYPQLTRFLELKADQVLELGKLEIEWERYVAAKARRVAQVESELRLITLAPVVDPSALGVRYMELEAICREARDTDKKTQASARKVLTDAQAAKLAVLEQAHSLLPVIGEADFAHLIVAPLPGLNLALAANGLGRTYPGCRFPGGAALVAPPAEEVQAGQE